MHLLKYTCLVILLVALLAACDKDDDKMPVITYPEGYTGRLQYQLEANYNFTTYVEMQGIVPRLKDTLRSEGPYTVLVYPAGNLYYYGFWGGTYAADMLQYGVLKGNLSFKKMPLGMHQPFKTLLGQDIYISKYIAGPGDTVITVNGSKVTAPDNVATNGFIQVINNIFPPPYFTSLSKRIASDTSLSMFAAAMQRSGVEAAVDAGNYTVLAPLNTAFLNSNTAMLGLGISTLDSLLKADPVVLKQLVQNHIITDGMLFNSDMQQAYTDNKNDTVRFNTLSGRQVKYVWYFGYEDRFWGNSGNAMIPATMLKATNKGQPLNNEAVGKNTIHRISQILVP